MPFWQELLLQAVGPLVTVLLGTLVAGLLVNGITRAAQERRIASEMRQDLIGEMTKAASHLYMQTQEYWRKRDREKASEEALALPRQDLDREYRTSRVAGEVLERRLQAYFESDNPRALWHSTMDLLTVRYFHLIRMDTEELLTENAGPDHSGLSVDQLRSQKKLLTTYRATLQRATTAVLNESFRPAG